MEPQRTRKSPVAVKPKGLMVAGTQYVQHLCRWWKRVAIYAVLLQNVAISGDAINSIWSIVGYTVLLCFSLFKTSSVAKTLLGAH